jgi:hypothetical protein
MRSMFLLSLIAMPWLATSADAQESASDPRCATVRVAFPAEFSRWSQRSPAKAGTSTRTAPVVVIGRGVDLQLAPADQVTPAAQPGKPAEGETNAGLALFQVSRGGTYRVALGEAAWIDVIRAGRAMPATGHGHGPICTGIRKIVDFRLTPGRYVLQLTGTPATTVPMLIARGTA